MLPKLLRSIVGVAVLALASGIACAQDASRSGDYRLGAGDSIKVQVYQNPELSMELRVSESGVVNYPLVGNLQLGGLTVTEAERAIAKGLKDRDILKAPQVSINVATVRGSQVAVLGQVQKPGRFPLETTTVRVSEMLAAAGGVTPQGDERVVVTGTRNGQPFRKEVDVQQLFAGNSTDDIVVHPGDTLFVAKAPSFFLSGEAKTPGSYRIERGMTVQQAIAAGGGITARGSINRVRITRKQSDGREVTIDPRLNDVVQPGDVVVVRESIF
ncbi:MAG TPA: polysaccharide export protein EpsE [Ramlibacter sp.]|nr:polysaccharide export protein EpsE [Ramlibacter sp.]